MNSGKILVTGSSGLVGSRFIELFSDPARLLTPDEKQLDITDSKSVNAYFADYHPDYVLHLAAFTDVNAAEQQRGDKSGSCWRVNVVGTKNLLSEAEKAGSRLIYISTDMVFPGSRDFPGPYTEDMAPPGDQNHLTWYGFSKLTAEKLLPDSAALIRLIYPVRAHFPGKSDYLRKPLKLFDEGKLYPMFTNQQVSVSFIDEIVAGLGQILTHRFNGIFHFSSSDTSTPYELVTQLVRAARGVDNAVKPSSIDDFLLKADQPYRYPKYGGLNSAHTAERLNFRFSSCSEIIAALVEQGIGV